MTSDYTNVIKGQRVARRAHSMQVAGNTVLNEKQKPAAKRPCNTFYGEAPRVQPVVQRPAQRQHTLPVPAQVEERAREEEGGEARQSLAGRVLPKVFIGLIVAGALGFFSYNALQWQNDYTIRPASDASLRSRMMEFAANGADSLDPELEAERDAASPALRPSEPFAWQYYTAKKGDSVSKIAAAHSLSMDAVIASNKMSNARGLREGDVLRIPNMNGIPYTITAGDTYENIAEKFNVPMDAILDANDIQTGEMNIGEQIFIPGAHMPADALKLALGELFIYPVRGRLSSAFGWRKDPFSGVRSFHKGIDIVADTGTPVKASMDGRVSMVGFSPILGRYVIITHSGGYQTMYAHLNSAQVARGARIKQGEVLGEVGNTGYSTGAHLHFVIYNNGREINPLEQLK